MHFDEFSSNPIKILKVSDILYNNGVLLSHNSYALL